MMNVKPVRVGVVGCGAFGESHIIAYKSLPHVSLEAVCDVNSQRAEMVAGRYAVPNWFADYGAMLESVPLDAVTVATPEDLHLAPVLAALRSGKHVLVEKPIATRLEDAKEMIDVARNAGVFLMPGHILRFETRYALVKEQIAAGELGELIAISARRNRPKALAKTYLRTHGVLEASIHDIDVLLWYINDRARKVRAISRSVNHYSNPDATWAIVEFQKGVVALIENMWLNPDSGGIGNNDAMQVTGTRGIANIDFVNAGLSLWREAGYLTPDTGYEPRIRGEMFGALKEELSYFTRCVMENRQPDVVSLDDALHGLEIALAIVESSSQDREVILQ